MKKLIVFVVLLAALGTGGWAYYQNRTRPEPTVTTVPVSRGEVVERVQATGTLEAVTTVTVGTQVSGVVQELYADFNSIVRKGQVIARLDPSILQVQIESQRANVVRAEADLERLHVALADAQQKYDRAKAMFAKELVPKTDYEAAELAVKSADAQIKSSEASLTQSKASLNQATVNLGYTVITSPIDGIVISRNVEPGQTLRRCLSSPQTSRRCRWWPTSTSPTSAACGRARSCRSASTLTQPTRSSARSSRSVCSQPSSRTLSSTRLSLPCLIPN